ncbi:aspartyl/glutamyl-tRNA amidotransferase subunit A [Candidatus Woesearchaeota archaeon]|nr:aspartyl/glutamyl-tRNA amidotransferase subunit A [Candidatus Woesearchaeota archaeon]
MKSTIEYIERVSNGSVDIKKETEEVLSNLDSLNDKYHYLGAISTGLARELSNNVSIKPKGRLAGVYVSVKDCIAVKGVETRSSSRILSGYKPVFNATVINKIISEGAIIIGKTTQDEFGFGSFSTNTGIGIKQPVNPFDIQRAAGGSSGGSAGMAQVADFPHISLGESTGGSIASPASFCGVVGLTPTYGLVSRYGLLDYANSMDKIGPIGKTVEDCALMLSIIAGHDEKDSTSYNPANSKEKSDDGSKNIDYTKNIDRPISGMKIGIVKESLGEGVDESIKNKVNECASDLKAQGAIIEEISLAVPSEYALPSYYIIAVCEASTNLAKYCGMRYGKHESLKGNFNEYFTKVRSKHFGQEAKRRIILGTFARMAGFRDAYYLKALKVRTVIINEYKKAFKNVDALLTPTMPVLPPRFDEIKNLSVLQNYMMDVLTVGPNLAGLPHINIPYGMIDGLPVGVMLSGDHFCEEKLLNVAFNIEKNAP